MLMAATLDFTSRTTFALPVPSHSDSFAREIKLPKISQTITIFFCRPHFPSLRISSSSRTSARWGKRFLLAVDVTLKKCWRDNLTDVTKPRYVTRAFLFISSPAIRFTWAEKGRPTYKHPATPLPLVLQRKPVRRLFISQSPLRIPVTSFSFQ